jgi:hypothetical protein
MYLVDCGIALLHSCIEISNSLSALLYPVTFCPLLFFFFALRFKCHKITLDLGEPGKEKRSWRKEEASIKVCEV